jgi:phosphoribosylglycinamide formyltransferase-1
MRCLFLTSGGGGDYLALERAREAGLVAYDTAAVVGTVPGAACLDHAAAHGYPCRVLDPVVLTRSGLDAAVAGIFEDVSFDLCFLAGFRYLLPAGVVRRFPNKIMNSHHSILPAHPGLYKKEVLVDSGVKLLGATVHYVDEGMDTGEILCQAAFPNYGREQFQRILHAYRRVQDVLAVTALRLAADLPFGSRQAARGDAVFWPAPDAGDLDLFFSDKETV